MQTFAPRGKIHGPILPQFVLETSLSFGAKIMYALLCNYASDNDHCWPSQATLAARLSCSVSSVKKYLAELVGNNLVHVRREHYRSSVYYMLEPTQLKGNSSADVRPIQAVKRDCHQSDSACPQSKSGYINTLNKQRELQNPPLPPVRSTSQDVVAMPRPSVLGSGGVRPEGREACPLASLRALRASRAEMSIPDFEKAWELYPKKEAKGLARAAWLRLQREHQLPPLARIKDSIRYFMATESWQREQGRFVPQMSNWLKGQRWLDDAITAATQETETRQVAISTMQVMLEKEAAANAARAREREALRPRFEAFAEKFQCHAKPWVKPMAFGLWMHLHTIHRAPIPADVPADNHLGIVEFLQAFKRHCEETAWRMSAALKQPAMLASGAFTIPRIRAPRPCDEQRPYLPAPSRQPDLLTFAKAM